MQPSFGASFLWCSISFQLDWSQVNSEVKYPWKQPILLSLSPVAWGIVLHEWCIILTFNCGIKWFSSILIYFSAFILSPGFKSAGNHVPWHWSKTILSLQKDASRSFLPVTPSLVVCINSVARECLKFWFIIPPTCQCSVHSICKKQAFSLP